MKHEEIAQRLIESKRYFLEPAARAKLQLLIDEACDHRGPDFGNARYVRNLVETRIIASVAARTSACKRPSREQLSAILPIDIPMPRICRA